MDTALNRTTNLTFGHSNQKDAFQCGREAAQMAKSQLPDSKMDLILALGPSVTGPAAAHFQDFIEGVRLVTGEKGLMGFPSHHIFTNDLYLAEGGLVAIIQSDTLHFSLASAELEKNYNAAFTSLVSQHRESRGNICHQYEYHGMLVADNAGESDNKKLIEHASVESGLDAWVVGLVPSTQQPLPLICNDKVVDKGLIAAECLSLSPVGIGTVAIGAFDHKPALYREAVKSALREAMAQMDSPPAAGFLFFDSPIDPKIISEMQNLFRHEESLVKDCPIVGLCTQQHGVKYINRSGTVMKETVVALLLPQ